jgi:hypothetical protein
MLSVSLCPKLMTLTEAYTIVLTLRKRSLFSAVLNVTLSKSHKGLCIILTVSKKSLSLICYIFKVTKSFLYNVNSHRKVGEKDLLLMVTVRKMSVSNMLHFQGHKSSLYNVNSQK